MAIAPLHDLDLHYDEQGTGHPVVLIGGLGQSNEAWAPIAGDLASEFRVISFDNRGAGESGAPDAPYSVEGMAADVAGLLDHLELEKAHIVSVSMGGIVARQLAHDHPKRVDRLVLAATGQRLDGYLRQVIRSFIDLRRSSIPDIQFMQMLATFLYSRDFFEKPGRYERLLAEWSQTPYPQMDHGFVRQAEAVLAWGEGDRIDPVDHEALVLAATDDILVAPALVKELAESLPNATYAELPGGHGGMAEHPAEWSKAIRDFLAS